MNYLVFYILSISTAFANVVYENSFLYRIKKDVISKQDLVDLSQNLNLHDCVRPKSVLGLYYHGRLPAKKDLTVKANVFYDYHVLLSQAKVGFSEKVPHQIYAKGLYLLAKKNKCLHKNQLDQHVLYDRLRDILLVDRFLTDALSKEDLKNEKKLLSSVKLFIKGLRDQTKIIVFGTKNNVLPNTSQ